jgi:transposase-like protein
LHRLNPDAVAARYSVPSTRTNATRGCRKHTREGSVASCVVDVYVSPTRDARAATAFFRRAMEETDERPERVTTDKVPCCPPALRAVLPEAEHVTGKMVQQGIERDHQHLKGRTRPMRGFQSGRRRARSV